MMKSIEPFERTPLAVERELAGLVARPDRLERAVGLEEAEEIVEPVIERVRIALDVEEQIARRGWRQRREPAIELDRRAGLGQEQLVFEASVTAALELDPGLLADARQRPGADVGQRRVHRQRQVTERFERRRRRGP